METEQETTIDPREFRNAMGRFATGVTIVTTEVEGETFGMTANAFLSVSLDPPLILISVGTKASMHERLPQSGRYGVSFLNEGQTDLSQHFAGQPVEGLEVPFVRKHDMPLIEGAVAHIVTKVVEAHPAGDHTLFIGEVEYLDSHDDRPLLFYAGKYHELNAEEAAD